MSTHACTSPVQVSVPVADVRPIGIFQRIALWMSLGRQRQSLALLEPHILEDLGLSPDEARREASRPVWDVPSNWRQ